MWIELKQRINIEHFDIDEIHVISKDKKFIESLQHVDDVIKFIVEEIEISNVEKIEMKITPAHNEIVFYTADGIEIKQNINGENDLFYWMTDIIEKNNILESLDLKIRDLHNNYFILTNDNFVHVTDKEIGSCDIKIRLDIKSDKVFKS